MLSKREVSEFKICCNLTLEQTVKRVLICCSNAEKEKLLKELIYNWAVNNGFIFIDIEKLAVWIAEIEEKYYADFWFNYPHRHKFKKIMDRALSRIKDENLRWLASRYFEDSCYGTAELNNHINYGKYVFYFPLSLASLSAVINSCDSTEREELKRILKISSYYWKHSRKYYGSPVFAVCDRDFIHHPAGRYGHLLEGAFTRIYFS